MVGASKADMTADSMAFLAKVGTAFWRMRQRLALLPDGIEARRLKRHLEAGWDAMTGGGVVVRDHTGEPFHHGKLLKVVLYQPTSGLLRERVIETVNPTIYFGERLLQVGEVIVGTPVSSHTTTGSGNDSMPTTNGETT